MGKKSKSGDGNETKMSAEKFYYTILAPKSFRANADFTLNITIHDEKGEVNEAIVVRASIEDTHSHSEFKVHRDVTLKPNVTEVISIPIGNVSTDGDYKLIINGISGIELECESILDLQIKTHMILIQTDKTVYKPSDCIQFRVLALDSELKPAALNKNELNISFTDPSGNLVKKFDDVKTINGVFSGEFPLSDQTILGEWKITAAIGDQVKAVAVEVAEYAPEKLGLIIDSKYEFTVEDEKVCCTLIGKNVHGNPFKGNATVSIFSDNRIPLKKKKITIDGQQTVDFDIKKEIHFVPTGHHHLQFKLYKIKADVIETATGLSQSVEKTICINEKIYKITADIDKNTLHRGTTVTTKVSVRKLDGSAVVFSNPNRKKITIARKQYFGDIEKYNIKEEILQLDDNGDVQFTFQIDEYESSFWLNAHYLTHKFDIGTYYTSKNPATNGKAEKISLMATVKNEKCYVNKEVEVEVMSNYPLPAYTYLIVGKGQIFEAKNFTPKFASDTTDFVHRFKFMPNSRYSPKADIIVFCVRDKKITSTHLTVDIHDNPKNFIELKATPDIVKIGQSVDISVKSNANSYIGLLGMDESLLKLRSNNDICQEDILNELELYYSEIKLRTQSVDEERTKASSFYSNPWNDFSKVGLITFSNTVKPKRGASMKKRSSKAKVTSVGMIRRELPDTWIWESIDGKSFNGSANFKKQVPDSMTTYVLNGFSIDPINGLAITKAPLKLCVQQQFHVSIEVPYSVKYGEVVTVKCIINSYSPNDIEVELNLLNENNEFEFVDKCNKKKVTIKSKEKVNALFCIRPTKVELINLKVSASSSVENECVIQTLNVEHEGVPQFENKAVFIDLREKSKIDPVDVEVDIPDNALPDSFHINIKCFGDILASTIPNLKQLIRLQSSCGEQNMINLVPQAVILNYLKNSNQLTDEIANPIKKVMDVGYQRQLRFKRKDGSFSPFGEADKEGSTWLTAFVATSFKKVAEYIPIEDYIIENALKWLTEAQTTRGDFNELGSVYHKEMQMGASNGVALTACALIAFIVNKDEKNTYGERIERGLKHIVKSVEICSDVYALAMVAYCLQLANHSAKKGILDRLLKLAKSKDDHKWWGKKVDIPIEPKTLNVEITSYGLLVASLSGYDDDSLALFKWLLTQRNDLGGFEGTQDTDIGLEALTHFASKIATKDNNVEVTVTTSNNENFKFHVDKANALVLQSQKLSPGTKSVRVNASGKGISMFEVSYGFNVLTPEKIQSFLIKPNAKLVNEDQISLEISLTYTAPKGKNAAKHSDMCVLEATLPSGFVVNSDALIKLRAQYPLIKRVETKNGETLAVLYFEHLTSTPLLLKISGFRLHNVDEKKPAFIIVYDYYDSALSAREFYTV